MLFLRKDELLELHAALIRTFGGIDGLRDEPGFKSAVAAPEQRAYDGKQILSYALLPTPII